MLISFLGITFRTGTCRTLQKMAGLGVPGRGFRPIAVPMVPIAPGIFSGIPTVNAPGRDMALSDGEISCFWSLPVVITIWVAAMVEFMAPMILCPFLTRTACVID